MLARCDYDVGASHRRSADSTRQAPSPAHALEAVSRLALRSPGDVAPGMARVAVVVNRPARRDDSRHDQLLVLIVKHFHVLDAADL